MEVGVYTSYTCLDLLNADIIFGTGFAPFRGVPMSYSRDQGVASIIASMTDYAAQFGQRFKPAAGWSLLDE